MFFLSSLRRAGGEIARALRLGGDEDGVPASGPAQRRDGIFDLRVHLGYALVVGHGDRALLSHERLRGAAANLVGGLGIGASDCRERIGALRDAGVATVDERVGADIPCRSVADAIRSGERRVGVRPQAVDVVAKAQTRRPVGLDLHDEMRVSGTVGKQVLLRSPGLRGRYQARSSA